MATDYKYIIMCGGGYWKWPTPKHMSIVGGEPLVARTIRLLREQGVSDISISSNNEIFEQFGVPVLHHDNQYFLTKDSGATSPWLDAFYPMTEPVCYIFGDVVFSPDAIKTIVETEVDSIEFFASAPPFAEIYPKKWAEPFAYKVKDTKRFFEMIEKTKEYDRQGKFHRQAVSWELWQVIKGTKLDKIDFTNYTAINDYTCDIDKTSDVALYNEILNNL
jgi:NDP-sugar pyrophosphorylase family protein